MTTANPEDEGSDAEEEIHREFFVKWQGWAHIHNTWDTLETLSQFRGFKKLQNYIKKVQQDTDWREFASPEEIEQADVNREMQRDAISDWVNVERIVAVRQAAPREDYPTGGPEYLVKWKGLPYSETTWEMPDDIKDFQDLIDAFIERSQQQNMAVGSNRPKERHPHTFRELEAQPSFLTGGQLRDYQLTGLNWLIFSWMNNTNGILADEMGLGKTVQTISFLLYLQMEYNIPGPFLVVVPLSTVANWEKEFAKWAPQMNVVTYIGDSPSRECIRNYEWFVEKGGRGRKLKFNALLTTYELIIKDSKYIYYVSMTNSPIFRGRIRQRKMGVPRC